MEHVEGPWCRTGTRAPKELLPLDQLLLLTATPDHCGPPGPVVSPVTVLQPLWLRNSTTAPSCELRQRVLRPGSSCLPGSLDLGYERNHNHTTTQCLLWRAQISARPEMRSSASTGSWTARAAPRSGQLLGPALGVTHSRAARRGEGDVPECGPDRASRHARADRSRARTATATDARP